MKSLCLVILLLSPFLRILEFQKGATVNPATSEFKLIVHRRRVWSTRDGHSR